MLWVTPSAPHHPRSSEGARGYLLIFTEAVAALGGEGVVCFLLGFYLCFKGWVKKRKKKKKLRQPSPGCGTWDSAAGGGQAGPPQTPIACE